MQGLGEPCGAEPVTADAAYRLLADADGAEIIPGIVDVVGLEQLEIHLLGQRSLRWLQKPDAVEQRSRAKGVAPVQCANEVHVQ